MIRKASKEDSDTIVDLCLTSRKKHMSFTQPAHTEAEIRLWMREELIPNQNVVVFEEDTEIKAMMATSENEADSWINHLFVEVQSIGKGYGSKLLEKALAELRRPIRLYAFQENHRARRFYESHGFVAIEFSDGRNNEEKCPDVLYELNETNQPNQALQTTSASARRLS